MWYDTLIGGLIGAGGAITSQFVLAYISAKSRRDIKKMEYLEKVQTKLTEFLQKNFIVI